jgi:hypothetical protein
MKQRIGKVFLFVTALILILGTCPLAGALDLDEHYTKFNISFWYPKEMSFKLESADDDSVGILFGRFQLHVLYVQWVTMPTIDPKQIDQALTDAINSVAKLVGLGNLSLQSSGEDNVEGHTVTYKAYSATLEGQQIGGAVGSWYCDKTTRLFTLASFDVPEGVQQFEEYLAKFNCHPQECPFRIDDICIPGFPIEGIVIGLCLGVGAIVLERRTHLCRAFEEPY